MWSWFTFWLILHILAVFVAFGPDFAFPFVARLVQKNPQHASFGAELIHMVEEKLTLPLAVIVPLLGVALIYEGHFDLWKSEWLVISIILYAATFFFAVFVQLPNSSKMLRMLEAMPPGPPPEGPPPPEIAAMGKRLQLGGMLLALSVVVLTVLMVWQPGNCQGVC